MCFGLGFYEAWGFARTAKPPYRFFKNVMFGFNGSFMMILNLYVNIIKLYRPCIFPLASPAPPFSLTIPITIQYNTHQKQQDKSQKSFLNENKHM